MEENKIIGNEDVFHSYNILQKRQVYRELRKGLWEKPSNLRQRGY